ncbi:MAG: Mu-like prophage major head subunit gpT family protein [Thermotogaceae bacterium]|nr:Mu-like prophage major head subunit gpT family protein [Thermotogaceae bacterium]
MAVNKSSIAYLISKDYDKIFLDNFQAEETVFDKIFNVVNSQDAYNRFAGFTGIGLIPKKEEGVNANFDEPKQKYSKTFTPVTYSLGVRITKEAFDDDKSGHLRKIPAMLASSARATLETYCAQIFDRSQNSSYLGADGKVLCATDHPLYGSSSTTSFSNRPTNNVDLSVSALEAAIAAMRTTPNDQGIPTALRPKYLLVHPSNWATVIQLLKNPEKAGTANRDINAIKEVGLVPIIWDYLTDTDQWYILTEKQYHQLMAIMREKINTKSYEAPDNTDDAIYRVRFRFAVGWVSPLGVYGSIGA